MNKILPILAALCIIASVCNFVCNKPKPIRINTTTVKKVIMRLHDVDSNLMLQRSLLQKQYNVLLSDYNKLKLKNNATTNQIIDSSIANCKPEILKIVSLWQNERDSVTCLLYTQNETIKKDSAIFVTKDSIITNQKTMIAINEKYIEDEIAYSDSVVKSRSFGYLRGLRDGVVLGAVVGVIIPKFIGK